MLEKVKNLSAIAQSVAVTTAVVIGGLWTLYVFGALGQREKAELDLKQQIQMLQPQAIIKIKMSISQPDWFGKAHRMVQVSIDIKNLGNRLEEVDVTPSAIHVQTLSIQPNGKAILQPLSVQKLHSQSQYLTYFMSPNEGHTIPPILISVPSAGVYLFESCLKLKNTSELLSFKNGGNPNLFICDSQYFKVK
jgi:hypothetical protein